MFMKATERQKYRLLKAFLYTGRVKFSILIHIVFLLTACKNGQSDQHKKVFRYNVDTGLSTLDPAFARDEFIIWSVSQLYNGLVQLDSDLKVQPCIAKRWEVADSGLTYTFYLRNDVYFHNNKCFTNEKGRKVTAHDFVYSLSRIINPATASTGAWIFNDKVDVKAFNTNEKQPFTAKNDSVFTIHLTKPFPPLITMLSMAYCYVVPKEALDMYGKEFRNNPVGTGPFSFKLWEDGVKLVLEKNPNYFENENGKRLPYLDAVEVNFVENKQTAFMEFVQGKLDFFDGLEGSYKDELLTKNGQLKPNYQNRFRLEVNPYLNVEYMGFLLNEADDKTNVLPWQNPLVRQAINKAIDREKMMLFLRNNIGLPGNAGFIPPSLMGSINSFNKSGLKNILPTIYNLKAARELLVKAGYPNGKGLPVLVINTNKNYVDIATFMQKQLKEIGITAEIEVNPGPTHRSMVSKGQLLFFRGSWIADYPDAENYLSLFYSKNKAPNGPNYTRFVSAQYDKLYEQSLTETNDTLRWQKYSTMDSIVIANTPAVVLYYAQSLRLVQPWVKGLKNNAMNSLVLKNVDIVGQRN
jgi:oligopeptide transport system substrate-binding protein